MPKYVVKTLLNPETMLIAICASGHERDDPDWPQLASKAIKILSLASTITATRARVWLAVSFMSGWLYGDWPIYHTKRYRDVHWFTIQCLELDIKIDARKICGLYIMEFTIPSERFDEPKIRDFLNYLHYLIRGLGV